MVSGELPWRYEGSPARLTISASLAAMRSIGMTKRKKNIDRIMKPFAARV